MVDVTAVNGGKQQDRTEVKLTVRNIALSENASVLLGASGFVLTVKLTDDELQRALKLGPKSNEVVPSMNFTDAKVAGKLNIEVRLQVPSSPAESLSVNIVAERLQSLALAAVAEKVDASPRIMVNTERKTLILQMVDIKAAAKEQEKPAATPPPRTEAKKDGKKEVELDEEGDPVEVEEEKYDPKRIKPMDKRDESVMYR